MAGFIKGDVVVLPFPFSDLSQTKRRPALVVAEAGGDELLLCQITSQDVRDRHAVLLNPEDFQSGSLNKVSNIRPNRIFTADRDLVLYGVGHVSPKKTANVVEELVDILRKGTS